MTKTLKTHFIACCLILFANVAFADTAVVRADADNSWATLGRLYVILATTDSEEPHGKVAGTNSNAMERLFRTHVAQEAVTVLKIPPQQLNRQTVLSLIANLPLRAEDAVVFYYSGKGDIDRRHGQYFELTATQEELYRSEVRSAILAKNPRLCVLISDFSAPMTAASNQNEPNEEEPDKLTSVSQTAPLFFELFFANRGIVDMNSSESGQVSGANENGVGYFTDAFTDLLAANSSKALSWRRVFPYVQADTSLAFGRNFPDGANLGGGRTQNTQTPVLLQFGDNVVASPTQLVIYPPNADPSTDATTAIDEERRETDRRIVSQLVQQAARELRPFDAADRGTHENFMALDVDNTFLGREGEPFATRIPPVEIADSGNNNGENAGSSGEGNEPQVSTSPDGPSQPIRLGIQATSNPAGGVIITRVLPDHPGAQAGLVVGAVILRINDKSIVSEQDYSDAIDAAVGRLNILVRNPGAGVPVPITVENFGNVPAK